MTMSVVHSCQDECVRAGHAADGGYSYRGLCYLSITMILPHELGIYPLASTP